jgi:hypothetical protein
MKAIFVAVAALLLCSLGSVAQKAPKVVVEPGQNASWVFPDSIEFYFPQFQEGFAITPDNKKTESMKMNFNFLFKAPQFINEKGDTLILGNKFARIVQIQAATFFHDRDKYYELLSRSPAVELAVFREWRVYRRESGEVDPMIGTPVRRTRTYDVSGTSAVRSDRLTFMPDSAFHFIQRSERLLPATRKSLLKLFPKQKDDIDAFLKAQDIDFDNRTDLLKALEFCLKF